MKLCNRILKEMNPGDDRIRKPHLVCDPLIGQDAYSMRWVNVFCVREKSSTA